MRPARPRRAFVLEVGVRPWKAGLQAYVTIGGRRLARSFPAGTPLEQLRAWRQAQQARAPRPDPRGSFGADIVAYLARVAAMPTCRQRARHLELWAQALGRDRHRSTITAAEVDLVLQEWLETCAAATVRKRRTALQSFFRKLDGRSAVNPARAAALPAPTAAETRGLDYVRIGQILAAMPASLARLRASVIAYTGLPPGLLQTVQATDVQLATGWIRVRPRRKGRGVEARTLPLTTDGLAALRAFHQAGAYGPFSIEVVNRAFQRAAARVGVTGVHLYDLRHSFGAELYRVTRDLATVGRFLLHADGSPVTARYARAANADVDCAAAAALSAAIAEQRRAWFSGPSAVRSA